jgi:hypothetical protein
VGSAAVGLDLVGDLAGVEGALMGIGGWIFRKTLRPGTCMVCGKHGPTSCLPFLGAKRFCRDCAKQILE